MSDEQFLNGLTNDGAVTIPDFDAHLQSLNRPSLAPGRYLAFATSAKTHISPDKEDPENKKSVGLKISFVVSTDPTAAVNGWNKEANVLNLKDKYFYLGKIVGGKLTELQSSGRFFRMLQAFGLGGTYNPKTDFADKQVILDLFHEPDQNEANKWWLGINGVYPYKVGDAVAPKLEIAGTYARPDETPASTGTEQPAGKPAF